MGNELKWLSTGAREKLIKPILSSEPFVFRTDSDGSGYRSIRNSIDTAVSFIYSAAVAGILKSLVEKESTESAGGEW